MEKVETTFCYDRDFSKNGQWMVDHGMASIADEPLFCDDGDEILATPGPYHLSEFWEPNWNRGRGRKPMTLRSWRNPKSVGGSCRKGIVRKMLRRLPVKTLSFTPSGSHLMG